MKNLNDDTKNPKIYNFDEDVEEQPEQEDEVGFLCPNCGEITREDVIFLCNVCSQEELIVKDGIYMCPSCLVPGENFECLKCESKEVVMKDKKKG